MTLTVIAACKKIFLAPWPLTLPRDLLTPPPTLIRLSDDCKNHVQGINGGFNVYVVFFNMVATFLSGFIVIGIPDGSRQLGFIVLCFLTLCTCSKLSTSLVQ